ncbi:MAG: N-acetylmuramoyl-L-alanine amidase [Proteobacteria bacterium]|nr:N-acetylmuramoyl-L-alanine amidase [Pseudomonadota bacterium]
MDDGLTRIIFDVKRPVIIDNIFTLPKDDFNKHRLVIDVKPASVNLFNARKEEIVGNHNLRGEGSIKTSRNTIKATLSQGYAAGQNDIVKAPTPPVVTPVRKPTTQYTVVVDPGHGGEDPGAAGQNVKEKFITLAVAKELKRQLEETGRYRVVLTRDQDFYIKLHDRVDISRRVKADLFISIHADKIDRKGVRGASIYTLSEKASDAETARLAEDENNAGFVAGVDLSQESQDVADILLDLAMREKMNESNVFAHMLTYSFRRTGVRLLPNSHRSAELLSSGQFQSNIAASIVDGVDAYFRKIKSLQKP